MKIYPILHCWEKPQNLFCVSLDNTLLAYTLGFSRNLKNNYFHPWIALKNWTKSAVNFALKTYISRFPRLVSKYFVKNLRKTTSLLNSCKTACNITIRVKWIKGPIRVKWIQKYFIGALYTMYTWSIRNLYVKWVSFKDIPEARIMCN